MYGFGKAVELIPFHEIRFGNFYGICNRGFLFLFVKIVIDRTVEKPAVLKSIQQNFIYFKRLDITLIYRFLSHPLVKKPIDETRIIFLHLVMEIQSQWHA